MLKLEKIKQFLKILLTVCIGIFIFLLSCYLCLFLFYYYHTTKNSNIYFNQITQITRAIYPSFTLEQPILKYSHKGVDESNYIAIYRITTPQINTEFVLKDQFVDCIKPTIKTKWMTPHLTFHYVQPPEYAKDHEDYEVHDSFIVHGSNKYVEEIAESCQTSKIYKTDPEIQSKFLALRGQNNISDRIYFDRIYMRYNPKDHLLFISVAN